MKTETNTENNIKQEISNPTTITADVIFADENIDTGEFKWILSHFASRQGWKTPGDLTKGSYRNK